MKIQEIEYKQLEKLITEYYVLTGHQVEMIGPVVVASIYKNGFLEQTVVVLHEKDTPVDLDLLDSINKDYPEVRGKHFISTGPHVKRQEIKEKGYHQQTPLNFFDLAEAGKGTASIVGKIIREGAPRRINETYITEGETGDNLVDRIISDIENDKDSRLRIVIAPAGYGKSVFMKALFLHMNDDFIDAKKRQVAFNERPHIILPEHLLSEQKRENHNISSAITKYLSTEYSTVNNPTFEFYIKNRLGILLFDGVEELIQQSPSGTIYELLEKFITCGDRSQIVITVRQQMLAAYANFARTLEEYKDYGIKIYQIEGWGKEKIRTYFHQELDDIAGPIPVEEFIDSLTEQGIKLLSTPYYSRKICDECRDAKGDFASVSELLKDEQTLVGTIVNNMLNREYTAGLNRAINVGKQQRFLVDMAEGKWGEDQISLSHLEDCAAIIGLEVASDKYFRGNVEEVIAPLKRHPLLYGVNDGFDFTHEIISEYFTYLFLDEQLRNGKYDRLKFRRIMYDSLLFRGLVQKAHEYGLDSSFAPGGYVDPIQAGNIFRLVLEAKLPLPSKESFIKLRAERRPLDELVLRGLNLRDTKFCESSFTNTVFDNCDLSTANFNQAIFKGTTFSNCSFIDATFEDVDFANGGAYLDGQLYEGAALRQALLQKTNSSIIPANPCEAAIDLQTMLDSMIRRGGRVGHAPVHKNDIKPRSNIQRRDAIIETCVESGILEQDDSQWYRLNKEYSQEINIYCQQKVAGRKITETLNSICGSADCKHLPER